MVSTLSDAYFLPPGDKVRWASGWTSEGRAADGSGETEEADAEEEPRVRLPDPPGEDGAAAPGSPGLSMSAPVRVVCYNRACLNLPFNGCTLEKYTIAFFLWIFAENSWPWRQDRNPEEAD